MERTLHLFALTAVAVAQPLLDLLGRHGTFFVAHRAPRSTVVLFAFTVVLAVPGTLLFVEWLVAAASSRGASLFHLVFVGVLGGAIVSPPIVRASRLSLGWALGLFLLIAAASMTAHHRSRNFRRFLTFAAPAPIVVLASFFLHDQIRQSMALAPTQVSFEERPIDVPIVWLQLDELSLGSLLTPSGSLDTERYPGFAKLARGSTWYRNATTVADTTHAAVPAALSGVRPSGNLKLPIASSHPNNLFALLDGRLPINATEFITRLCPWETCESGRSSPPASFGSILGDAGVIYLHHALPPDAASRWLPELSGRWSGFIEDRYVFRHHKAHELSVDQRHAFARTVGAMSATDGPALWYLHLALPHSPWRYLPSGRRYNGDQLPGISASEQWMNDDNVTAHALQRYLLQLAFTDRLVGRFIDHLEHVGLWKSALVIVTSDHGVSFEAGANRRLLDDRNVPDILPVPLFIRTPGQRRAVIDDSNVESIDVLPTLADVLDLSVPWRTDGVSVLHGGSGRRWKQVSAHVENAERLHRFPDRISGIPNTAHRIRELFPRWTHDPDALYALGPAGSLVGKPAESAARLGAVAAFRADDPLAYAEVNDTRVLPVLITGALEEERQPGRPVAVSLNGTVAGAGHSFRGPHGEIRIAVMLRPDYFRDGQNDIQVFELPRHAN